MPLEIKELHIKAAIGQQDSRENAKSTPPDSREAREAIIRACVERVLQIINEKAER